MIGDTNVKAMPVKPGTEVDTLEAGALVKGNIQGTPWEWKIVHQGNPDPVMYDASCGGCWLLLENIHSQRVWDATNNDYKNSDIQAWLNGDFFNMLDAGFRNQVKQVKIPYYNGPGGSGSVVSGAGGLSCKIFLLGGYEVGFTASDNSDIPHDGAKLSYFDSGTGSAANNKRIAKYNGSTASWRLRSSSSSQTNNVFHVNASGNGINDMLWSKFTDGIRPALILPSTALVDDELNILAV